MSSIRRSVAAIGTTAVMAMAGVALAAPAQADDHKDHVLTSSERDMLVQLLGPILKSQGLDPHTVDDATLQSFGKSSDGPIGAGIGGLRW